MQRDHVRRRSRWYGAAFSPLSLFLSGANGAWYDPSDFSTLFQNAAGTTPVTAVGQPVGLMLDKSKGLVLGSEQFPSYDFTTWANAGGVSSKTANSFTTTSSGGVAKAIPSGSARTYKIRIAGTTTGTLTVRNSSNLDGAYPISAGTFDVTITSPACFATSITLYLSLAGAGTVTITALSVRELPGNHAFNGSGNSANFPVLQQDGTGRYYLAFNGVNQWLQTNSIDFTYGDKVFVSAGVRKLSDAATAIAFELSASLAANIGAFAVAAPLNNSGSTFGFASKGTAFSAWSISGASFSAPSTVVLSGIGDISGSVQTLWLNASQVQNIALSQGAGNYGNHPLYIGARGGSSFFFNGRLYGLVVAGKAASASEIASTEAWLNQKTGAY